MLKLEINWVCIYTIHKYLYPARLDFILDTQHCRLDNIIISYIPNSTFKYYTNFTKIRSHTIPLWNDRKLWRQENINTDHAQSEIKSKCIFVHGAHLSGLLWRRWVPPGCGRCGWSGPWVSPPGRAVCWALPPSQTGWTGWTNGSNRSYHRHRL